MYRIFLFVAAVFVLKAAEAQEEVSIIRVKEGESVTVTCTFPELPTKECSWSNAQGSIFDGGNYAVLFENSVCTLTIRNASFEQNNGRLVCAVSNDLKKTSEIIVLIPPTDAYFELSNGERINGNLINADDHLQGQAELELNCVVVGGSPNATVLWQLKGEDVTPTSVNSIEIPGKNGFYKVVSTYTVKFDANAMQYSSYEINNEYEKNISCRIVQEAYPGGEKRLDIVVAKKYKTINVHLEKDGNVVNGQQKLVCRADGYPNPQIDFMDADGNLLSANADQPNVLVVSKEGKYVCLAGNELNIEKERSPELTVSFNVEPNEEPSEQASANIGVAVGASLGGIFLVIIVVAVSVFLYRREKLCFAKQSSRQSVNDAETGKTNDGQIPPDESYENQNLKADEEKGDIEKGDQNENMKPKEIVYAQLDLTQTNGHNTKKPKPETAKTEYARIQFQPKENQV